MKAAASVILPILVALFMSLLCIPPMKRLERHGVPRVLSLAIVVTFATLVVVVIVAVIGRSLSQFQSLLPTYQARLDSLLGEALMWLTDRGMEIAPDNLTDYLNGGAILRLVGNMASELLAVLSNVLLVVLTMIFMLLEANTLPTKLRTAMGNPEADLGDFAKAAIRVQEYLAIKAGTSLATGALVGILCAIVGVDFPLVWALIAFLLNFVPNIGSIIAAVPAILLCLVQLGVSSTGILAIGYFAINMVIGNVVEPKLMGRKLGLSTLVVFLSMLFWGWIWGSVGMLLSVPLTVILKILFEHSNDLRWLAVMLGPGDESDAHLAQQNQSS